MKTFEKTTLCGAVAVGLMALGGGGAALAQSAPPMSAPAGQPMQPGFPTAPADMPANPAPNAAQPTAVPAMTPGESPQPAMPSLLVANPTGTTTITNGPIPDTAANRAKYGGPKSHAGKKSLAKGN